MYSSFTRRVRCSLRVAVHTLTARGGYATRSMSTFDDFFDLEALNRTMQGGVITADEFVLREKENLKVRWGGAGGHLHGRI